ncbi:MAG: DNA sulfur modification protein DndD [Desulfamplus sp.]|nr:DNA sulfur modification protein DndD [Desulfamplus sp.]
MRFIKLTIENYKSFQFNTEITIPDSKDGRSIFLVGGMNGAGKTSIMEAINYCLYGGKVDDIYRNINRTQKAKNNLNVAFELTMGMDNGDEITVKRSWSAGSVTSPKARDIIERLVVIKDGKRVSVKNQEIWQDFIRAEIPPGITQFFFFDGEKIQEIAADDHSEVRLKSSLEAALGIQNINKLIKDLTHIKQEARKGFVEISDEDLDFKQSELKKEKSKLKRKIKERDSLQDELQEFRDQLQDAKERFETTFHAEPESRQALLEHDKKRVKTSNRLTDVENKIKILCEKSLPFALAAPFFDGIKEQIDAERESASGSAIRAHAAELAKKLVRVVKEPEPIFQEPLSEDKMAELEQRILRILSEGDAKKDIPRILNLSDRDAARVLNYIEQIEKSDIFLIQPLIEEKRELKAQIKNLEGAEKFGGMTKTERELFEQLQVEIESCSNQIGRKTEQKRLVEEEILTFEKRVGSIELEIEKLYEKHNVSRDKVEFIEECDKILYVLNQFIVSLRKNKIHILQEKTFEMYKLLSSRSGLIKDLTIDNKSYEIVICDSKGHEIKKSGLSAGEKEVFAVSLLWGLAQTSQLNLPLIIDTPLSRLDSTHRDNIVNNYFPNAGEQVLILSTDTEIDTNYYKDLKPYLSGAGCLLFDERQEFTTFKPGYFWEE